MRDSWEPVPHGVSDECRRYSYWLTVLLATSLCLLSEKKMRLLPCPSVIYRKGCLNSRNFWPLPMKSQCYVIMWCIRCNCTSNEINMHSLVRTQSKYVLLTFPILWSGFTRGTMLGWTENAVLGIHSLSWNAQQSDQCDSQGSRQDEKNISLKLRGF